jgi:hypothetical protein
LKERCGLAGFPGATADGADLEIEIHGVVDGLHLTNRFERVEIGTEIEIMLAHDVIPFA